MQINTGVVTMLATEHDIVEHNYDCAVLHAASATEMLKYLLQKDGLNLHEAIVVSLVKILNSDSKPGGNPVENRILCRG